MALTFVGLGLGVPPHLTLEALEVIRSADRLILDSYTSIIPDALIQFIKREAGDRLKIAERSLLEERSGEILEEASRREVAILVPGDPFIATTHQSLKTEALKRNVKVRVVHGLSIFTAAISASGLHIYKFGRTATIPKTSDVKLVSQPYNVLAENLSRGLHTLLLLDTAEGGVSVGEALNLLLSAEEEFGKGVVRRDSLVIALSRVGYDDSRIVAGSISSIADLNPQQPPHTLIFPGELHFTEKEAMKTYTIDAELVERYTPPNYVKERVERYVGKCRRVIDMVIEQKAADKEFTSYVEAYVEDSWRFMMAGDYTNALLAIGYAEGLLDALKLLGRARFEW